MKRPFRLTAAGLCGLTLLTACGVATTSPGSAPATKTATPVVQHVGIRPTESGTCHAVQVDYVATYKGLPTPAKAIAAFIASNTAPFPLPKAGWTTVDHLTYTSGTTKIEIWHNPHAGYAVTGASSC